MHQLQRLLYQHPKGVTLAEIAAHLAVTSRSARRYLDAFGLDVEAVTERPGGQKRWRIPAVDLPRNVSLRRSQAYALLATRGVFEPLRGSAVYEEIDMVAQSLLGVARRPGRGPNAGRETSLEKRFMYLPFAPKNYGALGEELDNLHHAVSDLRALKCRYPHPETGELERLELHPYALLLYKEAVWFLAYDTGRECIRTMELDRMRDSRCTEQRFELPRSFRVFDYVQGQFGIWRGGEILDVVIDFDPLVADHIYSRVLHPSQRLETLDDGGVRLRLRLGRIDEVATWVLGFGSTCRVVEPEELRVKVADELRAALEHYGPRKTVRRPHGKGIKAAVRSSSRDADHDQSKIDFPRE